MKKPLSRWIGSLSVFVSPAFPCHEPQSVIVLLLFGATAEILPKAMDYIFIMAIADGLFLLIPLMVLVGDNRKNFPKDTDGTGKLRKAGNL